MISGASNISIPPIIQSMVQGGKLSLPVDSSSLVYSHFQYVSGMPVPEGGYGVSISRLNLLDVLIGQISQLKTTAYSQTPVNPYEGMDRIIENFNNQIRQAKAASDAMPYIPSPDAGSGMVFNLTI